MSLFRNPTTKARAWVWYDEHRNDAIYKISFLKGMKFRDIKWLFELLFGKRPGRRERESGESNEDRE